MSNKFAKKRASTAIRRNNHFANKTIDQPVGIKMSVFDKRKAEEKYDQGQRNLNRSSMNKSAA